MSEIQRLAALAKGVPIPCPKCGIGYGSHSHTCPIGGDPEYRVRVSQFLCRTCGEIVSGADSQAHYLSHMTEGN